MYKRIAADSKTVTAFYGERTAIICASYLLPFIKNTSNILDIGCGPGRITADFSQIAKDGKTIGLDNSPGILEEASSSFPISDFPNLSFVVGDALKLDFPDNTFDIVHSHQLILHLARPVEALKEFRRVCKPGGIVATCDCSLANVLVWKPELPALRRYWMQALPGLQRLGMNLKAGDQLEGYAREVGFATMKYQKGGLPRKIITFLQILMRCGEPDNCLCSHLIL